MEKSNVYSDQNEIKCCVCGKDLMDDVEMSLVNIIQNIKNGKIVSVNLCCKGQCDKRVSCNAKQDEVSGWQDLKDFTNPYLYLKHIISVMNSMQKGEGFESREAFEEYKNLILKMYPYVTRNMSDDEKESALIDNMFEF